MIRAAVYARYSSERQNERSIGDQVAVLSRHADQRGWTVLRVFSDAAISGSAMANRPGLLDALASAERGEFEILLVEDEDRIARSLEHLAHVANRLAFVGARLATLSCDAVETMHVAFKGAQAQMFLANLSQKTKRGMNANAERGLATGSRLYGYRSAPGGAIEIVPGEAEVIRRIFAEYVSGRSPREIAARLNADRIAGVRGGLWSNSTICGSRQRANGILHTELYSGTKVFNRVEMRKSPTTGKRLPRVRPEAEWRRVPVPGLRIVDEDTWARARAQKLREGAQAPHEKRRRPAWLFSGLVRCGLCGGSYTVYTTGKLVCATFREKGEGACANRRTPNRAEIQTRVLEGLRERLLKPEVIADAMREYHRARNAELADRRAQRQPLETRLAEISRAEQRTIDAIERGVVTPAMEARMMERDVERRGIEAQLAGMVEDVQPIQLHPEAPRMYAELVGRLQAALNEAAIGDSDAERELVDAVRALVTKIELTPLSQTRGAPINITLHGQLAAFVEPTPEHAENRGLGAMVAGGGIEPPTCGL